MTTYLRRWAIFAKTGVTTVTRLCCIGKTDAQFASPKSPDQAAKRNNRFTKRTSPVVPDSSIRHCRLRIMRITSMPLIVADAVGSVLNPRVGLISRFSAP